MKNDEKRWSEVKALYGDELVPLKMGKYFTNEVNTDIKHISFILSRYKFVSKLLKYRENVKLLELGCAEAWGGMMFRQNLNLDRYIGVDLDEDSINWNKQNLPKDLEFIQGNFLEEGIWEKIGDINFDAVCSLDVIEHINPDMEDTYCKIISDHLNQDGVAVIGTPSVNMTPYACEASKIGHINLYDQERLYELASKYFSNVFIFGMNDEIVNTGFEPMACYIFAVCCNKKV